MNAITLFHGQLTETTSENFMFHDAVSLQEHQLLNAQKDLVITT